MEYPVVLSLWLIFNAILVYLVFYIVTNASEASATFEPPRNDVPSDDATSSSDGPKHAFILRDVSSEGFEDIEDTREQGELEEGEIRCPTCGQVQDADFTFCEVCISPL